LVLASVIEGPGRLPEVRSFPEPDLEKGAVLLRTIRSEVCGTDVHLYHGRLAETPYPLIPGHINVGEVEDVNGEILDVDGTPVRPGDVVTFLDVHETCNNCWFCLVAKASTRCPKRKVYGITYGANDGLLGGWSEKIYLKPGVKIVRLSVDPDMFIGGGCGLPTAFHAVCRGGVGLGDTVVVQGSGPVGLNAVALSRLSGATRVILVGAPRERLEVGLKLGADAVVDIGRYGPSERVEEVKRLTGGKGADVCIEATGVPGALREGMAMTRDAGTYVVVGQYTDNGEVTVNPHREINKRHLSVLGTWGIDFSHFYKSIRVMESNARNYPWHLLVSRRYGLHEAGQAILDVEAQRVVKAVIDPCKT